MYPIRRLHDQFIATLEDILAWASGLGITSHTRFHIFRQNIEWLRAHDKAEDRASIFSQVAGQGRLNEILSTMVESIEIVGTIPELRERQVAIPKELLHRVFSGPADASRENQTSNEARNAMFELSMGAMAARRGLSPTLSTGNPDVSFEFEDRRVRIECKRVLSENRIMERLKEGVKQLERAPRKATRDVGIVAVSLSKLVNPGDRFLVSDSPHDTLSQQLHYALKANEHRLARMRRPCVSAFLFYVSSAVYVPGSGYTATNSGTVFPLDLSEQAFLSRLAGALYV